jgi:iron(III)-salmochelin esterase
MRTYNGLSRRQLLAAALVGICACSRKDEPRPTNAPLRSAAPPPVVSSAPSAPASAMAAPSASGAPASSFEAPAGPDRIDVSTVFMDATQGGPHWIRIAKPGWEAGEGFPLLTALHGLGEAQKGREPGSWGWIKDYKLEQALLALRRGVLTPAHFQGFVQPKRLARINRSLRSRPFRGLVIACPYTPDLVTVKDLDSAGPFGQWLVEQMLPRVRKETGVLASAAATGLDGVSLGGRVALLVAITHPAIFGAVGSMQTAIEGAEAAEIAKRAAQAFARERPRLRLLSSDKDFYREAVQALHDALRTAGVKHELLMVPGPHAYAFNRGPGAIEMLLWHDRVLRGEPPL